MKRILNALVNPTSVVDRFKLGANYRKRRFVRYKFLKNWILAVDSASV